MKRLLILSVVFVIVGNVSSGYAQENKRAIKKIYAIVGSELGIRVAFKNDWTVTLSTNNKSTKPKNLPDDYDPGYTFWLGIQFPYGKPIAKMNLLNLTAGKLLPAGNKTWFTVETGISLIKGDKFQFTKTTTSQYEEANAITSLFGIGESKSANYQFSKEKKTVIGGMLKTDFNWAFSSVAGIGAGIFFNFNSIQSPIGGFQVKLIFGWMHNSKKKGT